MNYFLEGSLYSSVPFNLPKHSKQTNYLWIILSFLMLSILGVLNNAYASNLGEEDIVRPITPIATRSELPNFANSKEAEPPVALSQERDNYTSLTQSALSVLEYGKSCLGDLYSFLPSERKDGLSAIRSFPGNQLSLRSGMIGLILLGLSPLIDAMQPRPVWEPAWKEHLNDVAWDWYMKVGKMCHSTTGPGWDDYSTAFNKCTQKGLTILYKGAIERGDETSAMAEYSLAITYLGLDGIHYYGINTTDSAVTSKGLSLLHQSAEHGYDDAQMRLGDLYLTGKFVGQSIERSLYWYNKAAEQENARAQYELGKIYFQGIYGVPKDIELGKKWIKKAADKGYEQFEYKTLKYLNEGADEKIKPLEKSQKETRDLSQGDDD